MKTNFTIFLLLLSACNPSSADKDQAIQDARNSTSHIHAQYFGCYALGSKEKSQCVQEIEKAFFIHRYQKNKDYILAFQYEAEKLGFVNFINSHGGNCDEIKAGPVFSSNNSRYVAKCSNKEQYFLDFDVGTKDWKMK